MSPSVPSKKKRKQYRNRNRLPSKKQRRFHPLGQTILTPKKSMEGGQGCTKPNQGMFQSAMHVAVMWAVVWAHWNSNGSHACTVWRLSTQFRSQVCHPRCQNEQVGPCLQDPCITSPQRTSMYKTGLRNLTMESYFADPHFQAKPGEPGGQRNLVPVLFARLSDCFPAATVDLHHFETMGNHC